MYAETRSFSGPLPGTGFPLLARGISIEKLLNPFGPGPPARRPAIIHPVSKIHPVSMIPLPIPPRAPPGRAPSLHHHGARERGAPLAPSPLSSFFTDSPLTFFGI